MVQVTFDTKNDSLDELEHALQLLQKAIAAKQGRTQEASQPAFDMPKVEQPVPDEETAIDTGFLKITVAHDEEPKAEAKMPSLNELINDDSLSEEELGKLFKEQQRYEAEHPQKKKAEHQEKQDAYIEIIEYTDKD